MSQLMYHESITFENFVLELCSSIENHLRDVFTAKLDEMFNERLDVFKAECLRELVSKKPIADPALTFVRAVVEGHVPATVRERLGACEYAINKYYEIEKLNGRGNPAEVTTIMNRVKAIIEQNATKRRKDENFLDDATLQFLTLKADDLYALELVALAYTHRDFSLLLAAGYTQIDEVPTLNPNTGKYDPLFQAKLVYVQALLEKKVKFTQLESSKLFASNNDIEINDAGEIRFVQAKDHAD